MIGEKAKALVNNFFKHYSNHTSQIKNSFTGNEKKPLYYFNGKAVGKNGRIILLISKDFKLITNYTETNYRTNMMILTLLI